MARQLVSIDLDADLGFAHIRLQGQIGYALHAGEHALQLPADPIELLKILAVELERQGRTHAGYELFHPHLDRLGIAGYYIRNYFFKRLLHGLFKLLDVASAFPLILRLERRVDFHVIDVGGLTLFRATDHRQGRLDLREFLECLGDRVAGLDGLIERGGRNARYPPHDRAFLQLRHEFLAEKRKQREARYQRQQCADDHNTLVRERLGQHRLIATLDARHQPGVPLRLRLEDHRGQDRNQGQTQDHRTGHGEGDIESHRLEHLAFEAFKREQRQEYDDDDRDGKADWVGYLTCRCQHGRGSVDLLSVFQTLSHDTKRILDHDYGPIDHHAYADGQTGQRHQIGRQSCFAHANERN